MSAPIEVPQPFPGSQARPRRGLRAAAAAAAVTLAAAAGTVLLGVAAGFLWAAVAPRPALVVTGPGAAGLINPETAAFIDADVVFGAICLASGVLSGLLGFLFAVRRHGPPAMAGLLAGALAAAFAARWVGEQSGLAMFRHLLATLPAGARLTEPLALGASAMLGAWPLAAGLVAGGLVALSSPGRHRTGRSAAAGRPAARPARTAEAAPGDDAPAW